MKEFLLSWAPFAGLLAAVILQAGAAAHDPAVVPCPICGAELLSPSHNDPAADGIDSAIKAFHHYGFQSHPEAYLVRVDKAEKTGGGKHESRLRVTVVDRIKGKREIGEKFVFTRVSDSDFWDLTGLGGTLYYVFLRPGDDGMMSVDSQNPNAFWLYTEELRRVADNCKSIE